MSNGLLGDFCDGKMFCQHPLFSNDPHALQILFYYDEAEICNPIGSHRGVHKLGIYNFYYKYLFDYIIFTFLGFFYYTLGNLPPKYRATLKTIQLVTICKYSDVVEYGIDAILEPFVNAIKQLEAVSYNAVVSSTLSQSYTLSHNRIMVYYLLLMTNIITFEGQLHSHWRIICLHS